MQKNKFIYFVAQIAIIAAFGFMAAACASQGPTYQYSSDVKRAEKNDCLREGYVYIGEFSSEEQAQSASKSLGYDDYCYSDGKCYGIK